jgi:hypothetical protein
MCKLSAKLLAKLRQCKRTINERNSTNLTELKSLKTKKPQN